MGVGGAGPRSLPPATRDSPCGLGGSGGDLPGAREAPPSSSPSSGSSRVRTLGPLGGGIAGLGPALAAHGFRPAPLRRPRSAPAPRRAARAPALAAAVAQCDCLRPEPRQRPLQAASHPRGPPGTAPSPPRSARSPQALPELSPPRSHHPALPDSELQRIVARRVQSPRCLDFWSPRNLVQNLGVREMAIACNILKEVGTVVKVSRKCKKCPALLLPFLRTNIRVVLGR